MMFYNCKKRFHNYYYSSPLPEQQPFLSPPGPYADGPNTERTSDVVAQQHWATAMTETVSSPDCTCAFCVMRSETEDVAEPMRIAPQSHACRSLPSFRSVMEVLYPPSYLGTPSPFPDPPSYSRCDFLPCPAQEDGPDVSRSISSAPTGIERTPLSRSCPDPLSQDPSLTGVPSRGTPSNRVPLVEPSPPVIGLDSHVPEEPLPTYSRFDQCWPRFPAASDTLGPYPPMSVIYRSAR